MSFNLKTYFKNKDGLAAIESVFVFPVLMILLFGVVDIGTGVVLNTKVISATQIASDLVARENSIDDAGIFEAQDAAEAALLPYKTSSFGIDIVGILFEGDSALPTEQWRDTFNMSPNQTAITESDGLGIEGEGVVVVTVEYTYTPRFSKFLSGDITMRETAFVKGRDSAFVERN